MNLKTVIAAIVLATAAAASSASAQTNSGPVAANAYITFNGLNWAWASPCAGTAPSCGGFNVNGGGGTWRFATASEWAARPTAADFLKPSGNAGSPLGNFACASAWFSTSHTHCDWGDGVSQYISSGPGNLGSGLSSHSASMETWVVEGAVATPEPASLVLLATGLVGIAGVAIRRRKSAA